jgi:hypothetical protein
VSRAVLEGRAAYTLPDSELERLRRERLEARRDVMGLSLEKLARGDRDRMVSEIFDRISDKYDTRGAESLQPLERGVYAALWFEMEVNNGGLHQYFLNSAGDDAHTALAFLRQLDAEPWARVLEKAVARFEGGAALPSRSDRVRLLEKLDISAFEDLDLEFFKIEGSISGVLAAWLPDHLAELDLPPAT